MRLPFPAYKAGFGNLDGEVGLAARPRLLIPAETPI
jgi:hypothetical protein